MVQRKKGRARRTLPRQLRGGCLVKLNRQLRNRFVSTHIHAGNATRFVAAANALVDQLGAIALLLVASGVK